MTGERDLNQFISESRRHMSRIEAHAARAAGPPELPADSLELSGFVESIQLYGEGLKLLGVDPKSAEVATGIVARRGLAAQEVIETVIRVTSGLRSR